MTSMKTLAKFIPKWTKYNKNINNKINHVDNLGQKLGISYTDGARCAVGESRNWNKSWVKDCRECTRLGFGVYSILVGDRKKFLAYRKELYNHIKKDHPEDLQ